MTDRTTYSDGREKNVRVLAFLLVALSYPGGASPFLLCMCLMKDRVPRKATQRFLHARIESGLLSYRLYLYLF
ncbi:hypothetical protein J3E68DRAFT_418230 [Trichoderma sp. SZMC 28012]